VTSYSSLVTLFITIHSLLALSGREELALLKNTPSSELGSCRYKLKDPDEDHHEIPVGNYIADEFQQEGYWSLVTTDADGNEVYTDLYTYGYTVRGGIEAGDDTPYRFKYEIGRREKYYGIGMSDIAPGKFVLTEDGDPFRWNGNVPVSLNYDLLGKVLTVTEDNDVWSVIGSFDGWTGDTDMTRVSHGIYTIDLEYWNEEFKFRCNHSWDVNIGNYDYEVLADQPDSRYYLTAPDGFNFKIAAPGVYRLTLDVIRQQLHVKLLEEITDATFEGMQGNWAYNDIPVSISALEGNLQISFNGIPVFAEYNHAAKSFSVRFYRLDAWTHNSYGLVYDYFDRNYRGIPVLHDQYNFAPVAQGKDPELVAPATSLNPITQNNYRNQRNYTDVVAHYNKRFVDEKLGFGLMLGASQEMYTTENEQITRQGLSDLSLSVLSAASGTITNLTGGKSTWSMRSYFGRLNLDWDNKYYFQASLRGDGSSRFLKDNRWGWFPSFSAAWRISEEAFMKDNGIFDNLKLRVGYGSLGNNAVGNYAAYSAYSVKNAVIGDAVAQGLYQSSPFNPYLTWEKTKTFTVGLDFATLGQRLTGSIEYYNKKTDGILLWVELPNAGGDWTGVTRNAAEVSNKGVELSLGWNDKIGDFRYGISLNYSHNKNNVDKFRGTEIAGQSMSGNVLTWEGHELGSYYMYRAKLIQTDADLNQLQAMLDANPKAFDGVNPQYIKTVNNQKVLDRNAALGDIMIEDHS